MLNLIAIDLGASSGRVMQSKFNGDSLNLEEVHRFRNQPLFVADRMYWNIYSIFQELKSGIAKSAAAFGNVHSLAIDSWAVDFGLIDDCGYLVDLPRHYRDPRNVAVMNDITNRVDKNVLFARTGIQILPINSLFQLCAIKQENPGLLERTNKLLLIPDLLNFLLSGEIRAEFTNATTTQFMNAQTGQWDDQLFEKIGLPGHILPSIAKPGIVAGMLNDEELLQIPFLRATKVIHAASHDTASAVVCIADGEQDHAFISSGTWSLIGTVVQKPIINEKTLNFNFTNEGGVGNYRLLKNVMGLWLIQELQHTYQMNGEPYDIEVLIQKANEASPFGFLFDPDDGKLLARTNNFVDKISQICSETGQSLPLDSGSLVRGIFESLALKYRLVLDELEAVTGCEYKEIVVVGGGSRNRLLSQFTANATNRTIVTGPIEASTLGNVLVQLHALGEVASTTEMIELARKSVESIHYLPREKDNWDFAYERFLRIVRLQRERANEKN